MKFLLFSILIFAAFRVNAQQAEIKNLTDEVVSITTSSVSVSKWFELIEKKGIILSYNPSVIDLDKIRWVDTGEIKIGKLLKTILSDYRLKIIFAEPRKLILQAEKKKRYVISGKIEEEDSSENLYGATITFRDEKNSKTFAVSGNNGMYSINLPEGDYEVEVGYVGYKKSEKKISVEKDRLVNFELEPTSFEMKEVLVENRKGLAFLAEISPMDYLSFSSSDLFAQVRILPGVIASSANGDFQVNGGNNDENLMLLDGIPVYHSNHLNSMLPSFNGDAIKSVGFHKSLFPAQFEGRVSSVTDVRLKDGNKTCHSQVFSLDMPAVSVMFEGPIIKNKLYYMVSARRSWLDLFDNLLSEEDRLNHSFYDFNLKLAYDFNSKTSLQLIAHNARNNYFEPSLEPSNPVLKWNNELYACKLTTVFGKKLFNTTSLAYTSYSNWAAMFTFDSVEVTSLEAFDERNGMDNFVPNDQYAIQSYNTEFMKSGIRDISLITEFSYNVDNRYQIVGGINSSFEQFSMIELADGRKNKVQSITQFSFFYDNRIRITDRLLGQVGVNVVAYLPKSFDGYYNIQPRFSLKYTLNDRNLLYTCFSRMAQFYHYLRIDLFSLPTDFRMPSIAGYKPRLSNQLDVGWKHYLPDGLIESSLFYKSRENIIALKPNALPWSTDWKNTIMVGSGKSYGFRFFMYNKWQKLAFQLSYAYTRSFEWYPHIKERGKIPSLSDIPHALNAAVTYNLTNRSAFSMGGVLKTGRVIGNADDVVTLSAEEFRRLRYPFNYRLDASYSYSKEFNNNGAKLLMRVGLYNIIGNPRNEDLMDFYPFVFQRHCLPYWSVSIKF